MMKMKLMMIAGIQKTRRTIMCERKSMLIIKDRMEPLWLLESDSHTVLKKATNKEDGKLYDRILVGIEVLPKDDPFSTNPEDWTVKIDEEGTLPGWFENDKQLWLDRCIECMVKTIIPKEIETGQVAKLVLPKGYDKPLLWLKSVGGGLYINSDADLKAPLLESVGGYLYINSDADLKALKSVGSDLSINSYADLKALKSVGG